MEPGLDLQQQRRRAGVSVAALAAALGTKPHTIVRWEAGRSRPKAKAFEVLKRMAQGLPVDSAADLWRLCEERDISVEALCRMAKVSARTASRWGTCCRQPPARVFRIARSISPAVTLRIASGLKQTHVADMLGISPSLLSLYEHGHRRMPEEVRAAIADIVARGGKMGPRR